MSRDSRKDMAIIASYKLSDGYDPKYEKKFDGIPVIEVLEYYIQQCEAEKGRADILEEELKALEEKYEEVLERSIKRKFKIEELNNELKESGSNWKRVAICERNLAEYYKGEYDKMRKAMEDIATYPPFEQTKYYERFYEQMREIAKESLK